MSSDPKVHEADYAHDKDWRGGLLRRVGIAVVLLLGFGGIIMFFTTQAGHQLPGRPFGIFLMASSIALIGILRVGRISQSVQAVIIMVVLFGASLASYFVVGFLAGAALAGAFTIVLAALLFGRTAFVLTLFAFAAIVAGFTIAVAVGVWPGPALGMVDPGDPINWLRTGLISLIGWAGLGLSVMFVVNTVEQNLTRRLALVDSLRKEIEERRVAETARRDAEAVANQAQKMEAVGQLAAAIAHDFNNALLVIKGWNEIRGKGDADDRQREATDAIEQATEHSAQLGKQLLTFSRKDIRTPKLLYLDQVVIDTAESLRHLVGPHIELTVNTNPDGPVYADESQLQQLIFNLVINARDALAGSGNICVSVSHLAASDVEGFEPRCDRCVALTVEDDGPGIEAAIQERVFDPFFTTKAAGKGTGLGLTTVASIVEQSGGHVELRSRPGQTRFSVFLPVAEVDHLETAVEAEAAVTDKLGLRVLVLEDDARARNVIASALRLNGNEVLECDNGDAAMSLLSGDRRSFDLLCSDAIYPGEQLSDVLEAFERHSPDGEVLICSGYVQEELAIRKVESGEHAFLAKPFTGSQLIAKIRDIVN